MVKGSSQGDRVTTTEPPEDRPATGSATPSPHSNDNRAQARWPNRTSALSGNAGRRSTRSQPTLGRLLDHLPGRAHGSDGAVKSAGEDETGHDGATDTFAKLKPDEALSKLETTAQGLSVTEAERRLSVYGPNILAAKSCR